MDDTLGLAIFALFAIVIFYIITRDSSVSRPHKRGRSRRRSNSTPRLRAGTNEEDVDDEEEEKQVTETTRPHKVNFALFLMAKKVGDRGDASIRVRYRVMDAEGPKYREQDLPLYEAIEDGDTGWKPETVSTTGDLIVLLYQTITTADNQRQTLQTRVRLSTVSGSILAERRSDELAPISSTDKGVHVTCYIPPRTNHYVIRKIAVY